MSNVPHPQASSPADTNNLALVNKLDLSRISQITESVVYDFNLYNSQNKIRDGEAGSLTPGIVSEEQETVTERSPLGLENVSVIDSERECPTPIQSPRAPARKRPRSSRNLFADLSAVDSDEAPVANSFVSVSQDTAKSDRDRIKTLEYALEQRTEQNYKLQECLTKVGKVQCTKNISIIYSC